MRIINASAIEHNDTFLHIGYTSAKGDRYDEDNPNWANYRDLSNAIIATEGLLAAAGDAQAGQDTAQALVEPGWQAPGEYANLYRLVIPVNEALAVKHPVESRAVRQVETGTVQQSAPPPPVRQSRPWDGFRDLAGGYIWAILLSLAGAGLLMFARRLPVWARALGTITVAMSLLVCVITPAAQVQGPPTASRAGMVRKAVTSETPATGNSFAGLNQRKQVLAADYLHPELATMLLMHGLIGHQLYLAGGPVKVLRDGYHPASGQLDYAALPVGNYWIYQYHLDGWGREFRYRLQDISYDPQGNDITSWEYLLQSAGADGEFDTADDFRHVKRLKPAAQYQYRSIPPHYAVYVEEGISPDGSYAKLLVYEPQWGIAFRQSYGPGSYSHWGFNARLSQATPDNPAGWVILARDHAGNPLPGPTLQLYALAAAEVPR